MSQIFNLYRRSSGIYVVRISIPQRFRRFAGQCEIHTSTSSNILSEAKLRAAKLLSVWHQVLIEYERLDNRSLNESAPLVAGAGMITLSGFAQAIELPVSQLVQAVINRNLPVFWLATQQQGSYVEDLNKVETDPLTGGFVLNSAFAIGLDGFANGLLQPYNQLYTLRCLLTNEVSEDEALFRAMNEAGKGYWFFDLPAVKITPHNLMINKVHAEALRQSWLTKVPDLVTSHSAPRPERVLAAVSNNDYLNPKYNSKTLSWLSERYIDHRKKASLAESAEKGIRDYFALMIEVMGNVTLDKVDREFLRLYEDKLRKIPAKRNLAKIKYGIENLDELIDLADKNKDEKMTDESVRKYLNGVFGPIRWAVGDGIFVRSPCDNFLPNKVKEKMDQEFTDVFHPHELHAMFSLPWFASGTGERNKHGRFHQYRPFHYWAPLLGLFTGARVNELGQLCVADILCEESLYYLNIESDEESGKKLKNVNSRRKIPIHSKLIELGFIDYVIALKNAGHKRIFPELKAHKTKGFGRPVSSWFNESLLAKRLGFSRDRTKSFHSFRHTVATTLKSEQVGPEMRAQILGHIRGESETAGRYSKDLFPFHIAPVIEKLNFSLPTIAPFVIKDGLDAVNDALRMKRSGN